jgi:hypothetical protein
MLIPSRRSLADSQTTSQSTISRLRRAEDAPPPNAQSTRQALPALFVDWALLDIHVNWALPVLFVDWAFSA